MLRRVCPLYSESAQTSPFSSNFLPISRLVRNRIENKPSSVVYVDFAVEEQLYLISVFAKNEQGNLTAKQKKEIRDFVKSL